MMRVEWMCVLRGLCRRVLLYTLCLWSLYGCRCKRDRGARSSRAMPCCGTFGQLPVILSKIRLRDLIGRRGLDVLSVTLSVMDECCVALRIDMWACVLSETVLCRYRTALPCSLRRSRRVRGLDRVPRNCATMRLSILLVAVPITELEGSSVHLHD